MRTVISTLILAVILIVPLGTIQSTVFRAWGVGAERESLPLATLSTPLEPARPPTGRMYRLSENTNGIGGNAHSRSDMAITPNDVDVVYTSYATNLSPNMLASGGNVFHHNLQTRQNVLISDSYDGRWANNLSVSRSISDDGQTIVFWSRSSNIIPNDTNMADDLFIHHRPSDVTYRITLEPGGAQMDCCFWLGYPTISGDGRYVAYASQAPNHVPNDNNKKVDIFVYELSTRVTTRVSVSSTGQEANGDAYTDDVEISRDGRYLAYTSAASNLVPNDTNNFPDVFFHDRQTGETSRVSVSNVGLQTNNYSNLAAISDDGRYVFFISSDMTLDPNYDPNRVNLYVRDRLLQTTRQIPAKSEVIYGYNPSAQNYVVDADASGDGRFVAFTAMPRTAIGSGNQPYSDVFVYDRLRGQLETVTVGYDGSASYGHFNGPTAISPDGRYVGFSSLADNLVTNDFGHAQDTFIYDRGPKKTGLWVNYNSGAPGSVFHVQGEELPASTTLSVRVNNRVVGQVTTSQAGILSFELETANAEPGDYFIQLDSLQPGVVLSLDDDLPTREPEGIAPSFSIPQGIALTEKCYLPSVVR